MSQDIKSIEKMVKTYRDSLKPDWTKLSDIETPKSKNLEMVSVFKTYDSGEIIELNNDIKNLSDRNLDDIIISRRSLRKYQDKALSFDEFSYLSKLTCNINRIGNGIAIGVIPTGGARNTLETYFYIRKVEGIKSGLYHYMKDTNNIRLINNKNIDIQVNEALLGQLRDSAVTVIWTATPYRSEYKYSFTAHKMIAI